MTNPKANAAPEAAALPDANPLALVAGGAALGVVLGMLLPRLAKERELLDPLGKQLADRAHQTIDAVKETGKAEIESLMPGRDETREKFAALLTNVVDAAKNSNNAKG